MKKDMDRAEKCFHEARTFKDTQPLGYYYVGVIFALKGDKNQAFSYLNLATNKLDTNLAYRAWNDPDLVSLKSDKRFNVIARDPKAKNIPVVLTPVPTAPKAQ
jgi:hypothetical protein